MWSVLRDEVQVDEVSHSGSAVRTVPRVLNLPHVNQELLHLSATQSRTDHHLRHKRFPLLHIPKLHITHLKAFVNFERSKMMHIHQQCSVTK